MNDTKFGTWTVPESPVDIEYSLVVIDEIRQVVAEGFQRLSRGGIEVGGVLYGTHEGRTVRIMAMREIACEHARGPTFHLSENDRALLTGQLEREQEDPRLAGMVAVGWFLSHTRSEITLQQTDLETYSTFFPEQWQVTMVIRPGRAGTMRAGFFVREADGTVKTDHSYHDFPFPDRLAGILDRPPRERVAQGDRAGDRGLPPGRSGGQRFDSRLDTPSDEGDFSLRESPGLRQPIHLEQEYAPYPAGQRKLPWGMIGIAAVVVILAILGLRFFGTRQTAEPLSLAVSERQGQLQIQWNRNSSSIGSATRAMLEITDGADGKDKQTVNLGPKELASGSLTYARKTGDVQVRMVVTGSGGSMEEASRFLGTAPEVIDANEADLTKVQRDSLQDEVTRLREQNNQQAARIQQLERTLTVMRTRMGISQNSR
jgi:hypothetical protein